MAKFGYEQRFVDGVPVILGGNLFGATYELIAQHSSGGAVGVVYEAEYANVADDLIAFIKREQPVYRLELGKKRKASPENDIGTPLAQSVRSGGVDDIVGDENHDVSGKSASQSNADPFVDESGDGLPEHVRHIVAVGGMTAVREAEKFSKRYGASLGMYVAVPCCEWSPSAKYVALDRKVLDGCSPSLVAAAKGILYSQPLRSFEALFAEKILATPVGIKECDISSVADNAELAFAVLKLSSDGFCDSATVMAKYLAALAAYEGKAIRLPGEYKFLSSCTILSFYNIFLGSLPIDIMPPASRELSLDAAKKLNADFASGNKKVDFFDRNGYFKISYLLSEYRLDLLERLKSCDLRQYERQWRRTYPDAGFWLKTEIGCNDLFIAMLLAASESDGLLGYAYASGALKRFEDLLRGSLLVA